MGKFVEGLVLGIGIGLGLAIWAIVQRLIP